jgi:hypothetical protein
MPKFLYTALFLMVVFWGLWFRELHLTTPDSFLSKVPLLVLLFLSLGTTLSLPLYYLFYKQAPVLTNLKPIYRRSLRWSFFFSGGITFYFFLKVFGLLNPLNLILLLLLYFLLFFQLSKRGRRE